MVNEPGYVGIDGLLKEAFPGEVLTYRWLGIRRDPVCEQRNEIGGIGLGNTIVA